MHPEGDLLVVPEATRARHRPAALSAHRWVGVFYAAAGICGAGSAIVPPVQPSDLLTLVVSIPAIGLGVGLILRHGPLDERVVGLLLLLATAALSAGLWIDRDPVVAAAGGVLYVWVAWISGGLSNARQLATHLAACSIGFSCVVVATGVSSPLAVIVIVMGTSIAIGFTHRRMMDQLRASEARLTHAATHDALTLLPNRALVMDRLITAFTAGLHVSGLLYVDLDHFKAVNDEFGHDKGDAVLKEAARRMTSCIRQSDTLARVGGDEFVVLLDGDAGRAADSIAARILQQLRVPFDLGDGVVVRLSASIGIGMGDRADSPADVLTRADLAGLSAKRTGRDRVVAYHPESEVVPPPGLSTPIEGAAKPIAMAG